MFVAGYRSGATTTTAAWRRDGAASSSSACGDWWRGWYVHASSTAQPANHGKKSLIARFIVQSTLDYLLSEQLLAERFQKSKILVKFKGTEKKNVWFSVIIHYNKYT